MDVMTCPECGSRFGGPSMAAFGCCPTCLADDRFVRLSPTDAEAWPPLSARVRPVPAPPVAADRPPS